MMIVFCNGDVSEDLQSAFTANEVVPDTVKVAPKKILNVNSMGKLFFKKHDFFLLKHNLFN